MAEFSKIAWTTHTHNEWIGCTKVSPGCDNCYAEAMMDKRFGRAKWGAGQPRALTSAANRMKPFKWNREAEKSGERPFVFSASLSDWLDNEVDPAWRRHLLNTIAMTPNLVWLLLSKRIGNLRKMVRTIDLPPNVAIGSSFVNHDEYKRDIDKLVEVKGEYNVLFTFGSFEPLIGPVALDARAPDWIIVGGESRQNGQEPRYMHPTWARTMRDDAAYLRRAFFMKQMSDKTPIPEDLMVRQFPIPRN